MSRLDEFGAISRRRWLGLALGAGGLAAGGWSTWRLRGSAPLVPGLRCLTSREYRTLANLATAIVPAGGAFALGAADADLARDFDGFLADEPEWNRRDVKRALTLLEYGPVLFERRWTTFSALDDSARLQHYLLWANGDTLLLRQVALAFRKFIMLVFYDRPEAWAAIGFDGAVASRWKQ